MDDADSQASFPLEMNLPITHLLAFEEAKQALEEEYRATTRWLRLRCREVKSLASHGNLTLFELDVGPLTNTEWSWEGAVAFRPPALERYAGDPDVLSLNERWDEQSLDSHDDTCWWSDIIEVDETRGKIYVTLQDPAHRPRVGTFLVRPFEFLQTLRNFYRNHKESALESLIASRLNASLGGAVSPHTYVSTYGLSEMHDWWDHAWAILWGPPGTGKTYWLGKQIAEIMQDTTERILVVSTTNRATDGIAISIGRALQQRHATDMLTSGKILRLGKGTAYARFEEQKLLDMLQGTEVDALRTIAHIQTRLEKLNVDARLYLREHLQKQYRELRNITPDQVTNPQTQVIVTTAYTGMQMLQFDSVLRALREGRHPFTTVVIDEAGLLSRAATAALGTLASRRVVLAGDSKQLSPISKMSRVLPSEQSRWLAESALSHIGNCDLGISPHVKLLHEQHRMHAQIRETVSHFQYNNQLRDATSLATRHEKLPVLWQNQPRSVWYVLDEEVKDLFNIRAERGAGNTSWIRPVTEKILAKLFQDSTFREAQGLFITPFKAQATAISRWLLSEKASNWKASTVHAQQGAEANVVIFDTVNASSYNWPYEEWCRLINVGMSRAKQILIVLASRAEMREPYLRSLTPHLAPRVFGWKNQQPVWQEVAIEPQSITSSTIHRNAELLGQQFRSRATLLPVLSAEQQRLCDYKMDGGPRLVRGVAGSGKTWVMAHWLQKTLASWKDRLHGEAWAVYSTHSLKNLLETMLVTAWSAEQGPAPFPWHRVKIKHIREVLEDLKTEFGIEANAHEDRYNFDSVAEQLMHHPHYAALKPKCHALFVDEAQDLGQQTLQLLTQLVHANQRDDKTSRAVNIFYDNAQNIYQRNTPVWSEIGLDMRGRSTVMKESFRATRPICEYALNVLYRLTNCQDDGDHKELVQRGLIETITRNTQPWWRVNFNQLNGPHPALHLFQDASEAHTALCERILYFVQQEQVDCAHICVLVPRDKLAQELVETANTLWKKHGLKAIFEKGKPVSNQPNVVTFCTLHSFKGYEAEIVLVAGVEQFVLENSTNPTLSSILAHNLYVAMTRARSLLELYVVPRENQLVQKLTSTLQICSELLNHATDDPVLPTPLDDYNDLLQRLGEEHSEWLAQIWKRYNVQQEPMHLHDGKLLLEPLFWFEYAGQLFAYFRQENLSEKWQDKLKSAAITVLHPADSLP
jgi:AAA domain